MTGEVRLTIFSLLYVECFLIGFTATPVRYLDKAGTRDMSEELFHGSIASYYTLQDAINDKVLPVPHYVLGDILMNERVSSLETALTQVASYGRSSYCWLFIVRKP